MLKEYPKGYYTFAIIFILAIFSIGNWIERYQTVPLLLSYFSAFMGYLFLLQEKKSEKLLLGIGILSRVILFVSLPSLSDDVYRFIWDGTLLKNGIHPFAQLPAYYLDQQIPGVNLKLYDRLNSPDYFTIYPPLNQLIFWASASVGGSWLLASNSIRTILLLADIGSLFLLQKLLAHYGKSRHLAFWYFLNPLVILEFCGNVHFEGLVVFFLLGGIYFFEKQKNLLSATSLGLAVGTKLLPLIYLPHLCFQGIKNKKWWIAILAGAIALVTFLPLLNQAFISGLQSSLDLYFRKFEFNASLYFIAREIGVWMYGYNNIALIGPLLSILSLISILVVSIYGHLKKWSIPKTFLFILTTYLLFTTTVHPWYILPLVALGLLSGYWYPIVWSLMIFLTYFGYSLHGFELPIWIVVVEYSTILFAFFIDLRLKTTASAE